MTDTIPLRASLSQYRASRWAGSELLFGSHISFSMLTYHGDGGPQHVEKKQNLANSPVDGSVPAAESAQPSSFRFKMPLQAWIVSAVLIAVVSFAVVRIRSERLPLISRSDFEAARTKWNNSNVGSYKIAVNVDGMQPGSYEVVVLDGIASAARFNDRELTRQRAFGTWAVTGMFDTLSRDLETNDKHGYLILRAEFEPEFGYPKKYERIEMRSGSHAALQWEVTEFLPADAP